VSFLNLWWAAAVAAVVVPLLLILYFLKLRRRDELVPSTLLWKRAVQDLQVNAPFQRLRKNLLLLLQLLILAAAILALARPIIRTTAAEEERVVILIDRSASMNTREGDQTRLELAKEQAVRLVKTLNRRSRGWRSFLSLGGAEAETKVMVVAFADRAQIISPFTTNTAELEDLIREIKPTDGRTNLQEPLQLAEAYMAPPVRFTAGMEEGLEGSPSATPESAAAPAKLILISDALVADTTDLVLKSGSMELVRIGAAQDNVGITTLRTRRDYERPEILSVFLTVGNYGPDPVETDVSVYVDGTLRTVETVRLAGKPDAAEEGADEAAKPAEADERPADAGEGSVASLAFDLALDKAGVIEARLSRDDALATDNAAYAVVPPPRRQRVLVVTERNFVLDAVLRYLPLEKHTFVTPREFESGKAPLHDDEGKPQYEVVVFDKYLPEDLPAGNYLYLGVCPEPDRIQLGEPQKWHPFIWWDETHPVLRHVALEHVYVVESRAAEVPKQAEVLAEGPDGPILFRYAAEGRHSLVLMFPVEKATWCGKNSFPIFVYNAIRYLGGVGSEGEGEVYRPGAALRVPVPADVNKVRLFRPDGSQATLLPDASGTACFGGTERVGVYRVEAGVPGHEQFAVNLEDDWESDIAPRQDPLTVDAREVKEVGTIKTSTPEVWRWFVGAGLVLVLLEWWIYNRRVML